MSLGIVLRKLRLTLWSRSGGESLRQNVGGRGVAGGAVEAHGAVAGGAAGELLAETSAPVAEPDLDASLRQLCALCQLLTRVDVRILRAFERLLQLVQLLRRERRAAATLLPLQGNPRLRLAVAALAVLPCKQQRRLYSQLVVTYQLHKCQ